MAGFLPVSKKDMQGRNIEQLDFIYITGDAYVDHPSFGAAIITRVIEAEGFTIGVIAQPNIQSGKDFEKLGRPKYGFFISSGNIDSMVAHYTAAKRKRSDDAYSPGNIADRRPDRAVIVYCKKVRQIFGEIPIVIGGLEASLRRFAHYDYWDDRVRPSILIDSSADLLSYGMGEKQTVEIIRRLAKNDPVQSMTDIRGTCYRTAPENTPWTSAQCPSCEQVQKDKKMYAKAFKLQQDNQDEITGKTVIQRHGKWMVVQNPPMPTLTTEELDAVYELPFMRTYHPSYEKSGGVPAINEVEFSIAHNRGCFGDCNFCAITSHQGKKLVSRSKESVIKEAELLTKSPAFKGYIHDVGGPTANFRQPSCKKQEKHGLCKDKKCLAPVACSQLQVDHSEYVDILREMRNLPKVKKVFIRSGIRYDYMLQDEDQTFLKELVTHHISGQLKVAPEHCSASVLDYMGKPHIQTYLDFMKRFYAATKKAGKEQYLVPYLMSSHPGSTLKDAVELAVFLKTNKIRPEQVQDFYPTPGSVATCMFYTGLDPYTMKEVYIPRTSEEKAMQRVLLQYFNPKNQKLVVKALVRANRRDLIGNAPHCLVKPDAEYARQTQNNSKKQNNTRKKYGRGLQHGKKKKKKSKK